MSTSKSKGKLPSITKEPVELFSPSSLLKSPQYEILSSAKKLAAQNKNNREMIIENFEESHNSVTSAIKPNKQVKLPPIKLPPIEKSFDEVLNIRENLSSATYVSLPKLKSASHRSSSRRRDSPRSDSPDRSSHNKHGGKRKTRKSKKGNKTRKVNNHRRRSYKK